DDLWGTASQILARVKPPEFPARDVDLRRHGAKGDGASDCSGAFRAAIDACHDAGGGRVVVPAGRFLTGAIRLRSNVNLHLSEGATIAFRPEAEAYLPLVLTRFEGVELMNYSPFVYALDERNVAITGRGTLDGQASAQQWWSWRTGQAPSRTRLIQMAADGVPPEKRVFGDGTSRLRPNFVQPYRCENVLIEDVTVVNSPMWELHPVLCRNVIVRGVTINSHGPNNDGCDPESCRDVLIEKCTFDTGDDCIALKSGRNDDGRRLHTPIENVVIRDCDMRDGHGGVVIGSEISGGARNIFAEKCRMGSPRRAGRAHRHARRHRRRGGRSDRRRRLLLRRGAQRRLCADPARRGRAQRHQPQEQVRAAAEGIRRVAEPDLLEGVRDLTLTNVTVNGRRRDEHINR